MPGSLSRFAAAILGAAVFAEPSLAADTIKIGIIDQFSGPFAENGKQVKEGVEAFMARNGNMVGGRQVEVIYRDIGGTNAAVAKRLAEELIVSDGVSLLGGLWLSSEGYAVAPVLNKTKTPMVDFMAASGGILQQTPYMVRTSQSLWQPVFPEAEFAMKKGSKRAFIAVADFAPGYDVQEAFKTRFTALGGTIVGEERIPLNTIDFAPFAERIASAKPDFVDIFMSSGAPALGFIKAMATRGIAKTAIIMDQGGETDDEDLHLYDDSVIGVHGCTFYSRALDNPENVAMTKALAEKFGPDVVPNFAIVAAYDGMQVLYEMIRSQEGKPFDGTAAVKSVLGYSWKSPRGPVTIDPETRGITQNYYIRKVALVDGKLVNVQVETIEAVADPWAKLHPRP
jgi:branched-chain amino acid transport system substrate-binding protein